LTNTKWDKVIQKATKKKADDRYANVRDIVWGEEIANTCVLRNLKKTRKKTGMEDTLFINVIFIMIIVISIVFYLWQILR